MEDEEFPEFLVGGIEGLATAEDPGGGVTGIRVLRHRGFFPEGFQREDYLSPYLEEGGRRGRRGKGGSVGSGGEGRREREG